MEIPPLTGTRPEQPKPVSDASAEVPKTRYKIMQFTIPGKVWSVNNVVTYGDGAGILREIVVESIGMYDKVYVPVTLFNESAATVDETRVGQDVEVVATLNSRQYVDRNGSLRWAIQLTSDNVKLIGLPPKRVEQVQTQEHETVRADDPAMIDELPF